MSLYNDDIDSQEISFVLRVSQELTKNCPSGCNGRGQCILGRCQCEAGYDGPDCGQSRFSLFILIITYRVRIIPEFQFAVL